MVVFVFIAYRPSPDFELSRGTLSLLWGGTPWPPLRGESFIALSYVVIVDRRVHATGGGDVASQGLVRSGVECQFVCRGTAAGRGLLAVL